MQKDDPASLLIVTILYCIYFQSPAILHEPETCSESCVLTNQQNINDPEILKHIDALELYRSLSILALEA